MAFVICRVWGKAPQFWSKSRLGQSTEKAWVNLPPSCCGLAQYQVAEISRASQSYLWRKLGLYSKLMAEKVDYKDPLRFSWNLLQSPLHYLSQSSTEEAGRDILIGCGYGRRRAKGGRALTCTSWGWWRWGHRGLKRRDRRLEVDV